MVRTAYHSAEIWTPDLPNKQTECCTFNKAEGMAIWSAHAVYASQRRVKTVWNTILQGRAKCVAVMRSPRKIAITPITWLGCLCQ